MASEPATPQSHLGKPKTHEVVYRRNGVVGIAIPSLSGKQFALSAFRNPAIVDQVSTSASTSASASASASTSTSRALKPKAIPTSFSVRSSMPPV